MTPRTPNRRRAQLALLASACDAREPARIAARDVHGPAAEAGHTRLMGMQREAVLLAWPQGLPAQELNFGRRLEVRFGHRAAYYSFTSYVLGPLLASRDTPIRILRLSVPLCLRPARQRRDQRVRLSDRNAPHVRLCSLLQPRLHFAARLDNVSDGGLGAVTNSSVARSLERGTLLWAGVELPQPEAALEFVLRLTHRGPAGKPGHTLLGGSFQPVDDPSGLVDRLEQLERFAREHSSEPAERAESADPQRS